MRKRLGLRIFIIFSFLFISVFRSMAQDDNKDPRVLILLDESSSMSLTWQQKKDRYTAAKDFIILLMDSLYSINDHAEFALRAYGQQFPAQQNICTDTKLEVMYSRNNRTQMSLRLDDLHPRGITPIAYSLKELTNNDLNDQQKYFYSLILVTDGGESCGGNICETVRLLQEKLFFKPYIVSLVDSVNLQKQFDCLGTYLQMVKEEEIKPTVSTIVSAYRKGLKNPPQKNVRKPIAFATTLPVKRMDMAAVVRQAVYMKLPLSKVKVKQQDPDVVNPPPVKAVAVAKPVIKPKAIVVPKPPKKRIEAQLFAPLGVCVDANDNIYIADLSNNRIRKIGADGIINTIAGTGQRGFSGNNGPAVKAQLSYPWGVVADKAGNVYFTDRKNYCVRMIDKKGIISLVAGTGTRGYSGNGKPATEAQLYAPRCIAIDNNDGIYISDSGRVWQLTSEGILNVVAGNGEQIDINVDKDENYVRHVGDNGPATKALLHYPSGIIQDKEGNLLIVDRAHYRIRKVNNSGVMTTIAGTGRSGHIGDNGPATKALLSSLNGIALDHDENILFTDENYIRKIDKQGIITTIAGSGDRGYDGDGGEALFAKLAQPYGIAVDSKGNILIADTENNAIRKIDKDGIITTIAGNGEAGFAGDGGPAAPAH